MQTIDIQLQTKIQALMLRQCHEFCRELSRGEDHVSKTIARHLWLVRITRSQ